MKRISRILAISLGLAALYGCSSKGEHERVIGDLTPSLSTPQGEGEEQKVFDLLNLDYPGLEAVKAAVQDEDWYLAQLSLKEYFASRGNVVNPFTNLLTTPLSATELRIADQALENRFYVKNFYEDYDGSQYTYYDFSDGKGGINWELTVPGVSDQEFRYQRHRHQWMEPQARAYWKSRDEKYAKSILDVLKSWYAAYPVPEGKVYPPEGTENDVEYQWKGLQVSERVMNACKILDYCKGSEAFDALNLCFFLEKLAKSVEVIRLNYYSSSNILISQAQAVGAAGILFPEFAAAQVWAREGYEKLGQQLQAQFLEDGVQYELDPSYHIAAIADFREAYELARQNGLSAELGADVFYSNLYKAAKFVQDITFPDYSIDNFNDTRASSYSKSVLKKNFTNYARMFPQDREFSYMATEGMSGEAPKHLTAFYKSSGYYILRTGWDSKSSMLVLKNNYNPENKWHCQPDNGTFAIWHKGRNFLPDAGVFSYGGSSSTNAARAKYRATANHNTLTIGGATIGSANMKGRFVRSESTADYEMICTANSPKDGFEHKRTIFSFKGNAYLIVDEMSGSGEGTVNVNMHMVDNTDAPTVYEDMASDFAAGLHSTFADGNNMVVRTYAETTAGYSASKVVSDISNTIDKVSGTRVGYALNVSKAAGATARFITIAAPTSKRDGSVATTAMFSGNTARISVDGKVYTVNF